MSYLSLLSFFVLFCSFLSKSIYQNTTSGGSWTPWRYFMCFACRHELEHSNPKQPQKWGYELAIGPKSTRYMIIFVEKTVFREEKSFEKKPANYFGSNPTIQVFVLTRTSWLDKKKVKHLSNQHLRIYFNGHTSFVVVVHVQFPVFFFKPSFNRIHYSQKFIVCNNSMPLWKFEHSVTIQYHTQK